MMKQYQDWWVHIVHDTHVCCMLLLKEVKLDIDEEAKLVVLFDPAYRPDRHSRKHSSSIEVSYKEHPHKAGKSL